MLDPRQDNRFQFPPPRGGELHRRRRMLPLSNFNSRPREGANVIPSYVSCNLVISIPAPARGRTPSPGCSAPRAPISIPAPARGRTSNQSKTKAVGLYFNSRPREGANVLVAIIIAYLVKFQFPPPRGGELRQQQSTHPGPTKFNSRPREGANLPVPWFLPSAVHFNSRPREGANSKTAQNRAVYLVCLLKFGRISAILPYILSATRAKKRETPKIIGFLLRRPTGRSCMEQVGAGGVR